MFSAFISEGTVTLPLAKDAIDSFYLKENKSALLDIIMYSSQLMKKYGIKVN